MAHKEHTSYDAIGSASSNATLTGALSGNRKVLLNKYLPNIHLDVLYTPNAASTNAYAMVLVEASNDDGTTWFPIGTTVGGTTEIDVFSDSGTNMTTASGMPIIIPGDKTSTGGTAISTYFDTTTVSTHVRISAREFGQTSFGTIYIRASFLE